MDDLSPLDPITPPNNDLPGAGPSADESLGGAFSTSPGSATPDEDMAEADADASADVHTEALKSAAVDWVRAHPLSALAGALLVGMLLGRLGR